MDKLSYYLFSSQDSEMNTSSDTNSNGEQSSTEASEYIYF